MRRIFTLFLFAILLGGYAMAYDFSAVCESGQILYYNITSRTAPYTVEVTYAVLPDETISSSSYCGDIIIPERVNYNDVEYSVTRIGNMAFGYCYGMTSVTIPNSVTNIGEGAFFQCRFTSITIPNSVTSIGDYAFEYCFGLTSVAIPESVTNIGDGAFYGSSLTSVTIPNSVTSIGNSTFSGCSGITSVTIPNSVTSIGNSAFSGCSGITSVTIPNSVTSIGNSVFSGCSELTSVTIPNSVTSIGDRAFYYCSGLTSITIPNSVTSIGENAFWGTGWYNNQPDGILYLDDWCLGYKGDTPTEELTINEGTIGIANHAFTDVWVPIVVTIPNSVTRIGRAFNSDVQINLNPDNTNFRIVDNVLYDYGVTRLIMFMGTQDSYTIPNSVANIDEEAFSGCSGLTSVTIPNSVTSIGKNTFYGCNGLASVTIPNSVTSIGEEAFYGCSGLASVTIPNSVTSIGDYAFSGCSGLTEVTIGNSVVSIGIYAFSGCSSLAGTLAIPNSVTSIGAWAFADCISLTSVTIPSSVTSIANGTFFSCNGLASVTIGNSVESIGRDAFYNCSGLTSVTIPNSVTSIGGQAFYGCSGLTSIIIPNLVTSIGYGAFCNCRGLTSVIIPNSVTSIGNYAFENCNGLTSVTIPNSVTSIGHWAFEDCSGLTSFTIPNSVTSIGEKVFDGTGWYEAQSDGILYLDGWCLGYKGELNGALAIEEGTKGFADGAFAECTGLTSITIPNSVDGIGQYTFYANENLDSVSIGRNVESIGCGAFSRCTNLRAISILSPIPPEACYMFMASIESGEYSATDNIQLYVGCAARDAYMTSSWGGWFREITEECTTNPISIEVESNVGGRVEISASEASLGEELLVYVTIDDGYELDYIIAYNENDTTQTIPITRVDSRYVLTYKIIMPAFPVKIKAGFRIGNNVSELTDNHISIYPDPATDILNITSSETISEIEIVNVMGQVVRRIEVNADNAVCDVEDLTSGVYVVRIHSASAMLSQRKFVKE